MPPPTFTMRSDDHTQIVRPLTPHPQDAALVDHLVVRLEDGTDHHFPLFPGMRPERLRDRVVAAGIADFEKAWLHCDEAKWKQYQELVRAAWPTVISEFRFACAVFDYVKGGTICKLDLIGGQPATQRVRHPLLSSSENVE